MTNNRSKEKRRHFIEMQRVKLTRFECTGPILDVGGGGEGAVGILMGERVIAADRKRSELDEAPPRPVKVVMDARSLAFPDETFEVVTAFFSLMYIGRENHRRVFEDVHRVLKPGGRFLIWDVVIPEYPGQGKDIFVMPLEIEIKDKTIKTAYGVPWPDREQDMAYFSRLAASTSFRRMDQSQTAEIYYISLKNG